MILVDSACLYGALLSCSVLLFCSLNGPKGAEAQILDTLSSSLPLGGGGKTQRLPSYRDDRRIPNIGRGADLQNGGYMGGRGLGIGNGRPAGRGDGTGTGGYSGFTNGYNNIGYNGGYNNGYLGYNGYNNGQNNGYGGYRGNHHWHQGGYWHAHPSYGGYGNGGYGNGGYGNGGYGAVNG